jgi:hypothetical protein
MNPNQSKNIVAIDFDDTYGNISSGTDSDNFIVSDNTDIDNSNNIPTEEEKIGIETVNTQIDEPNAGIESVEQPEITESEFKKRDLVDIAQAYGINLKFRNKHDLFDYLKKNNII